MIGGWIADCAKCGTRLQVIDAGQDEFREKLEFASRSTGTRIVGLLNEEQGAWAVLPDAVGIAECPVCHHGNKILNPGELN